VHGNQGTIDLAIRVDVADRPRHIHDPEHGRRAITRWQVLARLADGTTRVAFFPLTGRTHQLRVHAAHRLGLGIPIRGDRLYGREAERMLLHAEAIEIDHPATGARLRIESPAPF
jgi:tRNA pseudouridine32 synthase/23S rRNA pseudouridine746 synthase